MIRTNEDLEGFLGKLERKFERSPDGTYVVSMGAGRPLVALQLATPVLVVEVTIGKVPEGPPDRMAALFRRLLEFNAQKLLHAAYGIQRDQITLSAALELESVDLNELEAVLADVDMALAEQVSELKTLVGA